MKTIDKIVITILILIPLSFNAIIPVSDILGIKTEMWMGIIGLLGLLISIALGIIYVVWRTK